jgi:hypothetical protein
MNIDPNYLTSLLYPSAYSSAATAAVSLPSGLSDKDPLASSAAAVRGHMAVAPEISAPPFSLRPSTQLPAGRAGPSYPYVGDTPTAPHAGFATAYSAATGSAGVPAYGYVHADGPEAAAVVVGNKRRMATGEAMFDAVGALADDNVVGNVPPAGLPDEFLS